LENILQSAASISSAITPDIIYSVASVAKPKEIKEIMSLALKNKFVEAREKLIETMLNYGLSGLDVIRQMQKEALELELDPKLKMLLIEKCAEIEFRMVEGADEFIQLEALLSIVAALNEK
jgi:replication factor C small subunit